MKAVEPFLEINPNLLYLEHCIYFNMLNAPAFDNVSVE